MTALLSVDDLSVRFGGLTAVDGVSLTIDRGRSIGLIGPNGAGKTTLFNAISGLQPAAGRVWFDGHDVSALAPHRRARLGLGRSFQHLGLMMDETVETNILAAQHRHFPTAGAVASRPWRWWRDERAMRHRLDDLLAAFGLAAVRHDVVADLSFGVARFVELAGVLISAPELLMLDEPTTGLDVFEVRRLQDLMSDLRRQGQTMLLIAHDVRFVMTMCDWVYVLAGGQLLAEGPPAAVQRDERVIGAYLGTAAQHG